MVADLHGRLEPLVFILAHVIQLGGQVVQLVQVGVLAQQVIEPVHIAVVVRDEPFLIGLPKVVLRTDPDALKDLFQFLRRGGKLHPFAHKGTLVVFAQVGDESGEGIIFVIVIMGHSDTSLSLRHRLFPMGLRLTLIGTFLSCYEIPWDKSAPFRAGAKSEPLSRPITGRAFAFYPVPLPSAPFLPLAGSIPLHFCKGTHRAYHVPRNK